MFASASNATLKILFGQAGPSDFPYDPSHRLTVACLALAVLANAALASYLRSPAIALVSATVNIAFMALFTRFCLARAKMENRFQQTFNAVLATSGLLTLAMVPFFAKLAPVLIEMAELLAKNPDLANQPDKLPQPPGGAVAMLLLLGIWQIVVLCRIFLLAVGTWMMLAFLGILLLMIGLQVGAG